MNQKNNGDGPQRNFSKSFVRGWTLRCPRCGETKLFRGWFAMHSGCANCDLQYEREPGFFLGAIYFNYGLTSLIATAAYPIARLAMGYPRTPTIVAIVSFVVLFPLWFHRYARSLWLGFDFFADPRRD